MSAAPIPRKEQDNVLFVYWQLLGALESRTNPKQDTLDRILVEDGYKLLNRIGYTTGQPQWIKAKEASP